MMLPQILKKVDLNDLEELCAAELTGMSKKRIISIINGQEMLESSNTDESDNSGPSLEIISDTEWLSDDDIGIKVEGGNSKSSKDLKKLKRKSQDQKKQESKSKLKGKFGKDGKPNVKIKLEKVKTEKKEKEKQKEKEGESLLDLLELEMRARAIRALIRKEEDASSSNTNSKNELSNNSGSAASGSGTSDQSTKIRQANLKEQLERIDVLMKHGDDEDVFVVIQPAPTIELLSSDSENEDHTKRVNQRLVSERTSESEKVQEKEQCNKDANKEKESSKAKEKTSEKDTNKDKDINKDKGKNESSKIVEKENENFNLPMSVIESNAETHGKPDNINQVSKELELEEGEIVDNDDEVVSEENNEKLNTSPSRRKIKKVKRNSHIRSRKRSKGSTDSNMKSTEDENSDKETPDLNDVKENNKNSKVSNLEEPIEIEESPKRENDINRTVTVKKSAVEDNSKIDIDVDKALDIEEIINLDDYPDDMDDLEKSDANKDNNSTNLNEKENKLESNTSISRSETWATRYYQQDDVQNVIRESKIQSEIRKRLRERQRQNKLNNSPKIKEQLLEPNTETVIPKPTGSVEEYLALKGLSGEASDDTVGSSKLSLGENNLTTFVNNDSSQSNENLIEVPVVIVKKAKLNENAIVVKKVEPQNVVIEHLNKVLKCEDSLPDKGVIVIKEDSMLVNKKVVIVKAPDMFNKEIEQTEESGNSRNDIASAVIDDSLPLQGQISNEIIQECLNKKTEKTLPLKSDDVSAPKSDSSEDNIVQIDDTSPITDAFGDASSERLRQEIKESKEQIMTRDIAVSDIKRD